MNFENKKYELINFFEENFKNFDEIILKDVELIGPCGVC